MNMTAKTILSELRSVANPEKAKLLQGFFKTGKGEYAEGDVFLGIVVPVLRGIVKASAPLPLPEVQKLLDSEYHEARMAGFLFLARRFKTSKTMEERKDVFEFYLRNARRANNWDLVDVSCRDIVGEYLLDKDRAVLRMLAESDNLWEQRIAIVSTWTFIKHRQLDDTFALSLKLMHHSHDLMHKAVGWMLRETGKKDREALTRFLNAHATQLPRTALRYAIEHYPDAQRRRFMQKK